MFDLVHQVALVYCGLRRNVYKLQLQTQKTTKGQTIRLAGPYSTNMQLQQQNY